MFSRILRPPRSIVLAFRSESLLEGTFLMRTSCMLLGVWLEEERKFLLTVISQAKQKKLISMNHCIRCNLQDLGETKRRLKFQFNEHRRINIPRFQNISFPPLNSLLTILMQLIKLRESSVQQRLNSKSKESFFSF